MGKDLKGRELGKGIGQRKDKLYSARFTNKKGKRIENIFQVLLLQNAGCLTQNTKTLTAPFVQEQI